MTRHLRTEQFSVKEFKFPVLVIYIGNFYIADQPNLLKFEPKLELVIEHNVQIRPPFC